MDAHTVSRTCMGSAVAMHAHKGRTLCAVARRPLLRRMPRSVLLRVMAPPAKEHVAAHQRQALQEEQPQEEEEQQQQLALRVRSRCAIRRLTAWACCHSSSLRDGVYAFSHQAIKGCTKDMRSTSKSHSPVNCDLHPSYRSFDCEYTAHSHAPFLHHMQVVSGRYLCRTFMRAQTHCSTCMYAHLHEHEHAGGSTCPRNVRPMCHERRACHQSTIRVISQGTASMFKESYYCIVNTCNPNQTIFLNRIPLLFHNPQGAASMFKASFYSMLESFWGES